MISSDLGKAVAARLSPLLIRQPRSLKLLAALEAYVAFVHGKGAGAGWDLRSEARVALSLIPSSPSVVFDVGANRGEWSSALLSAAGTRSIRLFLFEPSLACQQNLEALGFASATLVPAAVGAEEGRATLFSPDCSSPVASLYARRDSYLQNYAFAEQEVAVVTIDRIMDKYEIDRVDFMKIDAEGNDLNVLLGARHAIAEGRIRALSFEFGSGNVNSRSFFHDFWDLLRPAGFALFRICPGGALLELDRYDESLEYFRSVTNYVAVLNFK